MTDGTNATVQAGAAAMTGANPVDHPRGAKEVISAGVFDMTNLLGSSSCPPDQVIANGRITIPLSGMCGSMQLLGLLLVGLCTLVAARIVIEGV